MRSYLIKNYGNKGNHHPLLKYIANIHQKERQKLISQIYKILQESNQQDGYNIKEKWEIEIQKIITNEDWHLSVKNIFDQIRSSYWQEFAWKLHLRLFRTPKIIAKYSKNASRGECWRECGEKWAHLTHILFDCAKITRFWKDVIKHIKEILGDKGNFQKENLLLGLLPRKMEKTEQYLFWILRVTAMKQITRNWKTIKEPNIEKWIESIEEIQQMERLTHRINYREEEYKKNGCFLRSTKLEKKGEVKNRE